MLNDYKKTLVNSAVLLALACTPVANAVEGDAVGDVIQINTQTAGDQALIWTTGDVAMDADGDFIAVWTDYYGHDGDLNGVYMRRFSADGTALDASDRLVNTATTEQQDAMGVAMAPDGSFVILFRDSDPSTSPRPFYVRLYDADGNAQGDPIQVNTGSVQYNYADVAMAADGTFVVAMASHAGDGVVARRFDADGTALDAAVVTVNTTGGSYLTSVNLAMEPAGNYIVVWTSRDITYSADIRGRRYSADGSAIDSADFVVSTTTGGDQSWPNIAVDSEGNFVVAWSEETSGTGVYAKCFDAAGDVVKDDFPVIVDSDYTGSWIGIPYVAMDAEGDFAITALDYGTSDGDGYATYMQRYDSSCAAQYAEPVNVGGPAGSDGAGGIAMDADGDIVVVFTNVDGDDGDGYGVFAQRYEGKGHTVDLALVGSGDTNALGGDLTYTFTVTNNGSGNAVGLNLAELVPSGVSYTGFSSLDDWSCSASAATISCTLPMLASGAQSSVDITVDTSDFSASRMSAVATITNGVSDTNDTNNSETIKTGDYSSGGGALSWWSVLGGLLLFRRRR